MIVGMFCCLFVSELNHILLDAYNNDMFYVTTTITPVTEEVVRCNRQDVGVYSGAQEGVKNYQKWGCGDAGDLNGDVGMQWLAMYVNRSSTKGNPIIADSITIVKNEDKDDSDKIPAAPANCNAFLHMFGSKNPVKIDDK